MSGKAFASNLTISWEVEVGLMKIEKYLNQKAAGQDYADCGEQVFQGAILFNVPNHGKYCQSFRDSILAMQPDNIEPQIAPC